MDWSPAGSIIAPKILKKAVNFFTLNILQEEPDAVKFILSQFRGHNTQLPLAGSFGGHVTHLVPTDELREHKKLETRENQAPYFFNFPAWASINGMA